MLTNITNLSPEDAQETLQNVTGFFNDLNLQKILTIALLFLGCMVVMKIILKLTDRAFVRLDMEKGLRTFIHAAATQGKYSCADAITGCPPLTRRSISK